MINPVNNLITIEDTLKNKVINLILPNIVAVSKTYPIENIYPLINHGHQHFGENKVQEAVEKWTDIKKDFKHIQLHMIGKLQTNKVKFVVSLFDYIHSLDNLKLAEKISLEQKKKNVRPKIFIQVNIGNEEQKNGIEIDRLEEFKQECINTFNLDIVGLMCIPPANINPKIFFTEMNILKDKMNLKELSMGMSGDYLEATESKATFVRIGSKVFGKRI